MHAEQHRPPYHRMLHAESALWQHRRPILQSLSVIRQTYAKKYEESEGEPMLRKIITGAISVTLQLFSFLHIFIIFLTIGGNRRFNCTGWTCENIYKYADVFYIILLRCSFIKICLIAIEHDSSINANALHARKYISADRSQFQHRDRRS